MIALRNNLPLVEDTAGIAVAFERRWLETALAEAAQQAGYSNWWIADELAESVSFYLANFYAKNVILGEQLEGVVRLALWQIGYGEIARCFGASESPGRMSLLHCLHLQPTNALDNFFAQLAARIEALQKTETPLFCFYDLQPCVRYLQQDAENAQLFTAEPAWCARIVGFVREKIAALPWGQDVRCSIT